MAEPTAEWIAQRSFDLSLVDERQLNDVWSEVGRHRNATADDFMQVLLRREFVTNFQLERLIRGERGGYFYGDYKVLYLVAGGSFARVYRAVHRTAGKVVALKVLRRRYSDDPSQADVFYREGQMGLTLRHPNIVPIYEVYSKGNLHYMVMEFVEGRNLREFMKVRKKLDPVEATNMMTQLTSGLLYAHSKGVQHRDLKMTNILISSRGQAKLVDFGLATTDASVDDSQGEFTNQRTIDYAGLERASGVRKQDARSDIFFMGCIYFNMLTGHPPLSETRDRMQRLARSRYAEVPPIHQVDPLVPSAVATVVNKAMQFDPERRYQSPGEMLVDLQMATKKLAEGTAADVVAEKRDDETDEDALQQERDRIAARLLPDSQRRALMVVESDVRLQDVFRDALKKDGYRVLMTSDPQRALSRFVDNEKAADCVVFSTTSLGESALQAFNDFSQNEQTQQIPSVLLLDPQHQELFDKANNLEADHRVVVPMPVKLRQLREVLARLVPPATAE